MANVVGTSRGGGDKRKDHYSVDVKTLASKINENIKSLSFLSPECCIYKVPARLRLINEKAYTPRIVSIGPFHHGKPAFKIMEDHKLRYLQDFLGRYKVSVEELLCLSKENEEKIRQHYAEDISFDSDEFVKIILVDAAFIIEVILRYLFQNLRTDNDRIFNKPWLIVDINCDLLLLENQIPYFVLEQLFKFTNFNQNTFIKLTVRYFRQSRKLEYDPEMSDFPQVEHLTDCLRSCHIPRRRTQQILSGRKVECMKSATELHEAGVKIKKSSSTNLFDIKFSFKEGVLEIPHIKIYDDTESRLRNLLAFEQCHYNERYMSDYVMFMDSLIDTSKDVELLVHSQVIESWLGHQEDVSNLFNKLGSEIALGEDFYFLKISEELNDYCKIPSHKWKATLRHEYFKTPWRVLSIIAAFILLALAFIQAVCSILSVAN